MISESLHRLADTATPSNPFPGLRPFEFHESYLFFGRGGQSERLIEKLSRKRFLAAVGASGSGKSSLVRAGLLPALLGGMMPSAGSGWRVALMRPGNDPIGNLARALNARDAFGSEDEENRGLQSAITEVTLRTGNFGLLEAARQASMPASENLLVIADQFEELFRIQHGSKNEDLENDKAAFVKLLLEASRQREVPIYVVLTMRSDYLGDCAQFQDLPEAINESQYLIPRLTRDERREAIIGPIAVGSAEITPRLVNRLLNDVGDNPDQLPILQHALMRAWDEWKNKRPEHKEKHEGEALDLCCYEAIGGMAEALSLHADAAYFEVTDDQGRKIAEKMFKCLTEKGSDNREIRRPVALAEICAVADASEAEVIAVIENFRAPGRSFLMPPAEVSLDADSLVDISHESLIRNWKRLNEWVNEESRSARIYRRLAETAALHKEGKAGLWRDPDLQLALSWREQSKPNAAWGKRYFPDFDLAMRFLEESRKERESEAERIAAEALEKEARRKRELRHIRIFAAAITVLLSLAVGVALYAWRQQQKTKEGERQNRQLFYVASMNLARNAFEEGYMARGHELLNAFLPDSATTQPDDVRSFYWYYLWRSYHEELATLKGHAGPVWSVAFAPDGRTLASTSGDTTVKLWDVQTRRELASLKGHAGPVRSVAFAPDGRTLASASMDDTVKLWDVQSRRELGALKGHTGDVRSVAFAPDGRTLASASDDGTVKLWDVQSRREPATLKGHESYVMSVAFAPDGRTLASASDDGTVKLWDVQSRRELATLKGHERPVLPVAFAPDGRTLTSASDDGTVKLWDVQSRQELATFKGHANYVSSVTFAPDGRTLASASYDGTVKLWDVQSRQELATFKGHADYVSSVAFAPDGRTLASSSGDRTVKLWDVQSRQELATLKGQAAPVSSVAFAPDGRTLASSSGDRTVKLWDVQSRQELATLKGHASYVSSVAFAPDGRTLASASADDTMKLWDAQSHQELATLKGHVGTVRSLAFAPDGRTLASASEDDTVKLWDVQSREELAMLKGHLNNVCSVAFAPDGRTLASASEDGTVKLWDVQTRQELATFEDYIMDTVYAVAFAPDGRTLASADADNTVKLWDVQSRQELATLKGHSGPVRSVAFAPDGRTLASAGGDKTVKLWDVRSRQELATLKGYADYVSSVAFAPDGRMLASAGGEGTVKLYFAATDAEVAAQRSR